MDRRRVPPQSIEAERAVLGSILQDGRLIHAAASHVRREDFYDQRHGAIFGAMESVAATGAPIDLVTVISWLQEHGALEKAGGILFVSEVADGVPVSSGGVERHAAIVRDKAVLRHVISGAAAIIDSAYASTVEDVLEDIQRMAISVSASQQTGSGPVPIAQVASECIAALDKRRRERRHVTGLSTGLNDLDKMTTGLQPADLAIIAARPSMGKTALAVNIASRAARSGIPTLFFSLEMGRTQIADRILSLFSKIDSHRIRTGFIGDDSWPFVLEAASGMQSASLHIDDTGAITINDIRARARQMSMRHGLGLVVVDYLQLVTVGRGSKSGNREQEVAEISRSLKAMAKELGVPVIALSQLNRDVEKRVNKRPQLSDLRESGSVEQDADIVLFIYRDEVYNHESVKAGIAELIVSKQRNGPTGTVEAAYCRQTMEFRDLERHARRAA